jgi:hypothetical protein
VVPPVYKCWPKDSTPLGMEDWAQSGEEWDQSVQYSSCMAASLPAGHSYSLSQVEDPLLDLEAEQQSVRLYAFIRKHDPHALLLMGTLQLTHLIPANIAMANIHRLLAFSSLSLLASCLPAADPIDNGSACLSSWHAYDTSSSSWIDAAPTTTLTTETLYPQFDYDVPYTTLCDGYRRAVVSRTTTPVVTYDPPKTTTLNSYTEPEPSCTIPETACTAILSAFSSSSSAWFSSAPAIPSPGRPHCTTYRPCDSPEYPGDSYCFIEGNLQKVYYWPVASTPGDFCNSAGSNISAFAKPTSPPELNPSTVVTDGHTFTSPTNYVSFANLEAVLHIRRYRDVPNCGGTSYRSGTGVIAAVTGAFTTKGLDGVRASLDFADLNTMRYEDFKAQRRCKNNPCTVIEGFYTPELALPSEVLELQPKEWKAAGCRGTDIGTSYYHPEMVPLVTPAPVAKGKLL